MRMKRTGLSMAAAGALVLGFVTVSAGAPEEVANTYTGCLANGGAINKVAIGDEPAKSCSQDQVQISWSEGVPAEDVAALDDRVTVLEGGATVLDGRVTDLESRSSAAFRSVDCAAGETVGDALAEVRDNLGPVSIGISGMCEENVSINRDDVMLSGVERGDGIRSASEDSAVRINDSARVRFENMTISGGRAGIEAWGSTFTAGSVTVRETTIWGIFGTGSTLGLDNNRIVDNSGFGVTARGSHITVSDSTLSGNDYGLHAENGGSIEGFDLSITGNRVGLTAGGQGSITLTGSSIEGNTDWGIAEWHNGAVTVGGDSRIANNGLAGVLDAFNSDFNVSETVIENNGEQGIYANGSSTVEVGADVTIRNNASDGIMLKDSSYGFGVNGQARITDNTGWGINCAGPAAVTAAQNGFDMATISFSGNTNGDTNCP